MIRSTVILSAILFVVASCASNKGFSTKQTYAPAQFDISDVYVNMVDGIENSNRIRSLMKNASINTADAYNDVSGATNNSYPLEIEVSEVNYRKPNASANSGENTYIKYTAVLREQASGQVYRSLPVIYSHISTGPLTSDEAKQNAEKNMIENSIKNAFARLYGMQNIPQNVQTHFATNDIFADPNAVVAKPVITPVKPAVAKPVTPAPQAARTASTPEVIIAPDEAIIESTTADGGPTVLKCAVC